MWPHYIPEDHGQCKIKLTLYDDAFFKFTAFLCEWYLQKWFLKIFFSISAYVKYQPPMMTQSYSRESWFNKL